MRFIVLILNILFIFSSCKDPKPKEEFVLESPGIYVVNEGNFTYGNSSFSYIDLSSDTIFNNIFLKASDYPLGDVAQSITMFDSKIYVVINNSAKIYIIDSKTAKYIATINQLSSPRNIQIISANKAYVSDLYSNLITIFNPSTNEKIGTINANCSTEAFVMINNHVFITNWNNGDKLLKINTSTDIVEQQITITYQPNSIIADKNNNIWVLSDGGQNIDTAQNNFPALTCINADNMQIIKKITFSDKQNSPSHLCTNANKDSLFFINSSLNGDALKGGIFKMSINATEIPSSAFIKQENRLFYSMAVNSKSQIIISDAIDYIQQGTILFYSSNGKLINSYKAGIIPGSFLFNE